MSEKKVTGGYLVTEKAADHTLIKLAAITILLLFALAVWLWRTHTHTYSKNSGSTSNFSSTVKLSSSPSLHTQSETVSSTLSSTTSSNSASVSVNGKTYNVTNSGSINKNVQIPDGNAQINISVDSSNSGDTQSSHSSSSLQVNSVTSTEVDE